MDALQQAPDPHLALHLQDARRVLSLPLEASRFHWHPFGLYTAPMAKRRTEDGTWSRRLHVWHPQATPVGEASPYGVHTHSGDAASHVLVGTLHHHLYAFAADPEGVWQRAELGVDQGRARLLGHIQAPTVAGTTHRLPANQPHGVTKPPGLAVSLFEQRDGPADQQFTTWQRTDVPAEPLVRTGPVAPSVAQAQALAAVERALFVAQS